MENEIKSCLTDYVVELHQKVTQGGGSNPPEFLAVRSKYVKRFNKIISDNLGEDWVNVFFELAGVSK